MLIRFPMRTQPSQSRAIVKRFLGILTAGICIALSGCGPSVTCTEGTEGGRLLKTISDATTSVDAIADAAALLVSTCQLSREQQSVVEKALEKVALEGSADVQAAFYSKLSTSNTGSAARVSFLSKSTLIGGTARSAKSPLSVVDFEQIGKPFDRVAASPQLSALLKSSRFDNLDSTDFRLVKTDSEDLLLVRISANSGFSEATRILAFDISSAQRLSMPADDLDVVSVKSDSKSYLEYFFDCGSMAGDNCTVRDSRFVVDEFGKLKYVASVSLSDIDDNDCAVNMTVIQPSEGTFKPILGLFHKETVVCEKAPSIDDHGDPFSAYPVKKMHERIVQFEGYPNLVKLLDVQRKDSGDSALKAALWSQGDRWKLGLIDAALRATDISGAASATTTEDAVKALVAQHAIVAANLTNLKWVISNPKPELLLGQRLDDCENKLTWIQDQINTIQATEIPKPIEPQTYPVERVSIAIQREVQDNDQGVIRLPETPYRYIGVRLSDSNLVVLYSQTPLIDRPGLVTVNASRGQEPLQYMINGFTRNVWMYRKLSDKDMAEHREHRNKQAEREKTIAAYKAFQQNPAVTINQLLREISTVDIRIRLIGKDALQ